MSCFDGETIAFDVFKSVVLCGAVQNISQARPPPKKDKAAICVHSLLFHSSTTLEHLKQRPFSEQLNV